MRRLVDVELDLFVFNLWTRMSLGDLGGEFFEVVEWGGVGGDRFLGG